MFSCLFLVAAGACLQLCLGRPEAQHIAVFVIEAAAEDGEDVNDPTDPTHPGRERPDHARADFTNIIPMESENPEKNAQCKRDPLAFRGGRSLAGWDIHGPASRARCVREPAAGDPDRRVALSCGADRVLQTLWAEAQARAAFIDIQTHPGHDLLASPEPCAHITPPLTALKARLFSPLVTFGIILTRLSCYCQYDLPIFGIKGGDAVKIFRPDGRCNTSGERVKEARERAGLSQEQLAARIQLAGLSISQKSISRIETGVRIVADYELAYLADALDVTIYYLLGVE